MSGIRSLTRRPVVVGAAAGASAPIYVNSSDNTVRVIPAGTGTTEQALIQGSATGAKIVGGLGTFVSGAATIATGLTSIVSFQAELLGASFATGATEVTAAVVTGAPATGSVVVQGYRLNTQTVSASGTGQFYWLAIGL